MKIKKGDFVKRKFTDKRYFGLVLSVKKGTIKVENLGAAAEQFGKISYVLEITLKRMNHYDLQREIKLQELLESLK
jgi:hypothetical protein